MSRLERSATAAAALFELAVWMGGAALFWSSNAPFSEHLIVTFLIGPFAAMRVLAALGRLLGR